MNGIILVGLLVAVSSYAQDAEWPTWYSPSNKPTKKITFNFPEIPASALDLVLTTLKDPVVMKYEDAIGRQQILENYPRPDLTLVLGVRYLGTNAPPSVHLMLVVFPFETVCCARPDGSTQRRKIPSSQRFTANVPMPTPVRLGDRFFYPDRWRTAEEWFGPMRQEGPYIVWWEKQGRRSNTLIFMGHKSGPELVE